MFYSFGKRSAKLTDFKWFVLAFTTHCLTLLEYRVCITYNIKGFATTCQLFYNYLMPQTFVT